MSEARTNLTVRTQRTQRVTLTANDIAELLQNRFDLPLGQAKLTDSLDDEIESVVLVIRSIDDRELP